MMIKIIRLVLVLECLSFPRIISWRSHDKAPTLKV